MSSFIIFILILSLIKNEKKTDKKKLEEFIRVDHAGERGAIKIYEGQLLALKTIIKNDELKKKLKKCKSMKRTL